MNGRKLFTSVFLIFLFLTMFIPLYKPDFIPKAYALSSTVGTSTQYGANLPAIATSWSDRRLSFFAQGRYWIFYDDEGAGDGRIVYRTSTDGSTWSVPTVISNGGGTCFSVTLENDNQTIHYAYSRAWFVNLYYRKGTLNSNGTVTWAAAEQTVLTADPVYDPVVCVDSDGYPWIAYASTYFSVVTSTTKDGTWTTKGGYPVEFTDSELDYLSTQNIIPLSNGKLFYWVMPSKASIAYGQYYAYGYVYDGAAWGSVEQVTAANFSQGIYSQGSAVAESDTVNLVYADVDHNIKYANRTYGVGWGSETTLASSQDSTSSPVITIDPDSNNLYVAWASGNILYSRKFNGTAWEPAKILANETVDSIAQASLSGPEKVLGNVISYYWCDGTDTGDGSGNGDEYNVKSYIENISPYFHADGIWIYKGDTNFQVRGFDCDYTANSNMTLFEEMCQDAQALGMNTIRLIFAVPDHRTGGATAYDKDTLNTTINLMETYGLYPLLECYTYGEFVEQGWTDEWQDCWVQIATDFANDTRILGFELCNEPYGIDFPSVALPCYSAIRAVDTHHLIWLSEYYAASNWVWWQEGDLYSGRRFWIPVGYSDGYGTEIPDDSNIVLTLHHWPNSLYGSNDMAAYQDQATETVYGAVYLRGLFDHPVSVDEFGTYDEDTGSPQFDGYFMNVMNMSDYMGVPWVSYDNYGAGMTQNWTYVNLAMANMPYTNNTVFDSAPLNFDDVALPYNMLSSYDSYYRRDIGYNRWGPSYFQFGSSSDWIEFNESRSLRLNVWESASDYYSYSLADWSYFINVTAGERVNASDYDLGDVNMLIAYSYTQSYVLTVQSTSGGTVNPSAPGTYQYASDSNVTLTASPSGGYTFAAWEIDGVNETTTSSAWYVVMDGNHTAKAYFAEDVGPPPSATSLSVALSSPASGTTVSDWYVNFTYVPNVVGDKFYHAYLWVNGSNVAGNLTAVQNNTANTIGYAFTSNGTYNWNVQVWNSTMGVLATLNRTLIVTVVTSSSTTITPGVTDISTGLVLHYTFDEGGGTVARDHSGYGNDGTISGASWTSGKYGYALSFDGVNDFVGTPNSTSLRVNTITVVTWVNLHKTTQEAYEFLQYGGSKWTLYIYTSGASPRVMGSVFVGGVQTYDAATTFTYDEWHQVGFTYDGTTLYNILDGDLYLNKAGLAGSIDAYTTATLQMNARYLHNGKVDDVRIYNRALSAGEVSDLYHYLTIAPSTGKVGYVFRPDTHTVNDVTGYKISTERNSVNASAMQYASGDLDVYWSYRIWMVQSTGTATELTITYSGIVYRSNNGEGLQSSTVTVPETALVVGFDAVKVVVYMKFGSGQWLAMATFVTDKLEEKQINGGTWTFTLYTKRAYGGGVTTAYAFWGNTNCESGIANVEFTHPTPQEIGWSRGSSGDLYGMVVYPYLLLIGNMWYGLGLLFIGGLTYQKYRKFEPLLIMLLLFGGAGSIGFLIPDPAFRLLYIIVLFVICFILYRVFR